MDVSVHITIWVRKYSWKEFVYDVCNVLIGAYAIARTLLRWYYNFPFAGYTCAFVVMWGGVPYP